ncbi:unnamed protein product, partial [Rotaria socialis]
AGVDRTMIIWDANSDHCKQHLHHVPMI